MRIPMLAAALIASSAALLAQPASAAPLSQMLALQNADSSHVETVQWRRGGFRGGRWIGPAAGIATGLVSLARSRRGRTTAIMPIATVCTQLRLRACRTVLRLSWMGRLRPSWMHRRKHGRKPYVPVITRRTDAIARKALRRSSLRADEVGFRRPQPEARAWRRQMSPSFANSLSEIRVCNFEQNWLGSAGRQF